jgi:ribosomal protein L14
MSKYKRYVGDGVYIDFDGFSIVLTTEDGRSVTNRIVLEPEVYREVTEALTDWAKSLAKPPREPETRP